MTDEARRAVRPESPSQFVIASIAAGVVAAVLGLWRIGRQSLWLDELFTAKVAAESWGHAWKDATGQNLHSGVHLLATWMWVKVVGDSETALRSLSLVFGVVSVVALMVLAKRLFGRRTAFLVAPVFLVHAQTIHYFQEARSYSLAMLAAVVAALTLRWALDDRTSTRRWLLYGLVAGAATYSHLFIWFVVASHVVAVALLRVWPRRRAVAAATLAFIAVVSPLLVYATRGYDNIDWIPATDVAAVRDALTLIVLGGGRPVVLLLIGALWMSRAWTARRDERQVMAVTIVLSWLVVPFVLAIAVSFAKPVFVSYYLNVCVPAAALMTAAALDALADRSRTVGAVGCALVLLYNGRLLAQWYDGSPAKEDFRDAVAYACRSADSDSMVLYAPDLEPARYYEVGECGRFASPRRLFVVVRHPDPRPTFAGWVPTEEHAFVDVDVVTLSPAP